MEPLDFHSGKVIIAPLPSPLFLSFFHFLLVRHPCQAPQMDVLHYQNSIFASIAVVLS